MSVTPSGGWIPACVAGNTGIGLSQRMQAFVLDAADNPFNVLEPGKRPRVTLTPTLALRNNIPFVSFAVQGGDSQDQNLLQFFLNMVEFDMNVQEACEAPNVNSFQMKSSFDKHLSEPGRLLVNEQTPDWTRRELKNSVICWSLTEKHLAQLMPFILTINMALSGAEAVILEKITALAGKKYLKPKGISFLFGSNLHR